MLLAPKGLDTGPPRWVAKGKGRWVAKGKGRWVAKWVSANPLSLTATSQTGHCTVGSCTVFATGRACKSELEGTGRTRKMRYFLVN